MIKHTFKVGDLRALIRESAQEFKPVLGNGVEADDRKNNDESYKETAKKIKDFDGGLTDDKKGKEADDPFAYTNATPMHFNPRTEPSKEWKDRVKAEMEGKNHAGEADIDDEASGVSTKGNKAISSAVTKAVNDVNDKRAENAHKGLTARMDDKDSFKKPTMCEEKKAKRLVFKHTRFVNEAQMLSRIPDDYKQDGQIIFMVDKVGNEYIVECEANSRGNVETNVKGYTNRQAMNEQVSRISELMEYRAGNHQREEVRKTRINESDDFRTMMDVARGLGK